MAVAVEQHAERVISRNDPLQPDAIGQKDRDLRPLPLQMLEEGILETVNVVLRHLARRGGLNESRGAAVVFGRSISEQRPETYRTLGPTPSPIFAFVSSY